MEPNNTANSTTPATNNNDNTPLSSEQIAKKISEWRIALTNAKNPDILIHLTKRKISEEVINNTLAEVDRLESLNNQQKKEYGDQYNATEKLGNEIKLVHEDHMDNVGYGRIVFKKNPGARTALGLVGNRSRTQSGYIAQGVQFYENALKTDEYASELSEKAGIEPSELADGLEKFRNLQDLMNIQKKESGEAQTATQKRDDAFEPLEDFMQEFFAKARIALRKYPQLLEQLGVVDPS